VGIAAEDVPRVFQEFQQLDGTMSRRHGGAGLGLAISRRFVELHGGRIRVDTELGRGSTFSFSLPTQRQDPIAEPAARSPESALPAPARPGQESILLAVTRSPSAATLLARYVRGCRTVVAQDLEQAAQLARQLMPQAVVIDAGSQPLDAGQVEALGQSWGLPRTPFMACALPGEDPLQRRLRVEGYLVKPVTRQTLWDVLRRLGKGVDTVLTVDDDRDFVRLVGRLLDSPVRRYQVIGAYTAQEGLAMMKRRVPDLILLDLRLPDMGGLEMLAKIRANPAWEELPVVIVSAQDEADTLPAVSGAATLAKASGLLPGELVRWVQNLVDMNASGAGR
jgi:CheY-like chemotaxis protein